MPSVKDIRNKVVHGGGFFTLLRSGIAAQLGSWSDMGTRFLLFTFVFVGLSPFYRSNISVACGAFVGGIVNGFVNYRFTFHVTNQNVKVLIIKYILVWAGSLLLNMYGTTFMSMFMAKSDWLIRLGFKPAGIFAAATLLVSLIVSLGWNFVLQRNFVYRPTSFDRYALALVNLFTGRRPLLQPKAIKPSSSQNAE